MKPTDDTVTQAFQCGGSWRSELGPKANRRPDGVFVDLVADGSGNLSGNHSPRPHSEKKIKGGRCERPGGGGKQRITIQREDEENEYEYRGEITDLLGGKFEANGRCIITPKRRDRDKADDEGSNASPPPPPTDEEWVATRPPNV